MSATDDLRAAADLIENGWSRFYVATTKSGRPCRGSDPAAVAWGIWGALDRVTGDDEPRVMAALVAIDLGSVGRVGVWECADGRTQAEVVARLRTAS